VPSGRHPVALSDRGFYGFKLCQYAAATVADLLWRVKTNLRPRHLETLSDGSWLARIVLTSGPGRGRTDPLTPPQSAPPKAFEPTGRQTKSPQMGRKTLPPCSLATMTHAPKFTIQNVN